MAHKAGAGVSPCMPPRNYGKSGKVPPNVFGLIRYNYRIHHGWHNLSINVEDNSEQHNNFLTKVTVIIHVLIQFYMSAFDIR